MKKLIMIAVVGIFSTGLFANEIKTNSKFVIKLSTTNQSVKKTNRKEAQMYEIRCSNGNSCCRSFDSLQAAWDYASGFCQ